MGAPRGSLGQRFWKKVTVGHASECWIWNGAKDLKGYGRINAGGNGRALLAHRVSWELENGEIAEGQCALHSCDVPSCVNPRHLFLGTIKDNNRDMWEKNRGHIPHHKGERNPAAKLTQVQVNDIRKLREAGWILKDIAEKYEISISNVHWIITGKHWQ